MNIVVEFELPSEQYEQLATAARTRHMPVAEVAQAVVQEWLESQVQLDQARALMRELGESRGEGTAPGDVARNHDCYLYTQQRS